MSLPSAYAVALLTVINVKRYSDEAAKRVSRFRMSRQALCKLGRRQRLRGAFIEEYEEHLEEMGWTMIEMSDGGYAFIETISTEGWTKISSKRVIKEINEVFKGNMSEKDLEKETNITYEDYSELNDE